jgi:ketosteroid isomerase-like protein
MRNADRSLAAFRGTGYELLDTEVRIHGDIGLVYYVARYDYRDQDGHEGSIPLRSVDVYCREGQEWNQCGSHITPIPRGDPSWGEGGAAPRQALTEAEREELLAAREAVWRAWFAGDREALLRHVPAEAIAIDPGVAEWADREGILARATAFREGDAALVRLEFPRTRIQAYGDVAILYTEYLFETVSGGTLATVTGRGTEVFVRRDGRWVNSGWHLDSGR